MKFQVILVIVSIAAVQGEGLQPALWAKHLIKSVKDKMTSFWTTGQFNGTKPQPPLTSVVREESKQTKFTTFLDKARRIKKLVKEHIKPEEKARNPEIYMTTPQLIASHNYPAESHTIVTDDGYVLTLHRIPFSKKLNVASTNGAVLLHHGILGSSADWVLTGPDKSLAYILADAGYDVWLANARGNSYSRAHLNKDPNSFAFWNFTFHEVGMYDLPAIIDYIKFVKNGANLHYIGHSMGTTVLFTLLSTKVKYNKELTSAIALAPVAYMKNIRSPIRLLAKYASNINFLLKLFTANEFLPRNDVLRWMSQNMCSSPRMAKSICENAIFVLCGHDAKQFNKSLLPMILSHVPAGASTLTLVHYAQEIRDGGRFQYFDYGRSKNYDIYGAKKPPAYPIENITLPIALISSKNDWLSGDEDVSALFDNLQNVTDHYVVPYRDFNHIDFLWANNAPKLVYTRILQLLHKFDKPSSPDFFTHATTKGSVRDRKKVIMLPKSPKPLNPKSKVDSYSSKIGHISKAQVLLTQKSQIQDFGTNLMNESLKTAVPEEQLEEFGSSIHSQRDFFTKGYPEHHIKEFGTNKLLNDLGLTNEPKESLFDNKAKYMEPVIIPTTKRSYMGSVNIFPPVDDRNKSPPRTNFEPMETFVRSTTKRSYIGSVNIFPPSGQVNKSPLQESYEKKPINSFKDPSIGLQQVYPAKVVFKTFF